MTNQTSNWKELLNKTKNNCKQITEINNLIRPTIWQSQKWLRAIDQTNTKTITITTSVIDGIT